MCYTVVSCCRMKRKPTVMFIRTFLLVWSNWTVTERIPSSTTTTKRGKRKKATSEDARRQSTTDKTTYSFLQQRKYSERFSTKKEINVRCRENVSKSVKCPGFSELTGHKMWSALHLSQKRRQIQCIYCPKEQHHPRQIPTMSGHFPDLAFHTLGTQQEIVRVRCVHNNRNISAAFRWGGGGPESKMKDAGYNVCSVTCRI